MREYIFYCAIHFAIIHEVVESIQRTMSKGVSVLGCIVLLSPVIHYS